MSDTAPTSTRPGSTVADIGHTDRDLAELLAAGVDPATTQPNETARACLGCFRPTRNQAGFCDSLDHYRRPAACERAAS